jgi:hypothetical protein
LGPRTVPVDCRPANLGGLQPPLHCRAKPPGGREPGHTTSAEGGI